MILQCWYLLNCSAFEIPCRRPSMCKPLKLECYFFISWICQGRLYWTRHYYIIRDNSPSITREKQFRPYLKLKRTFARNKMTSYLFSSQENLPFSHQHPFVCRIRFNYESIIFYGFIIYHFPSSDSE